MTVLRRPLQNSTALGQADIATAQQMYWKLFVQTGTTPRGVWDTEDLSHIEYRAITPAHIEIADFFLSDGALSGFLKTGLGIITVVNASECVKYLLSLPGQLLPWHAHISVAIAPTGFAIPDGHEPLSNPVVRF